MRRWPDIKSALVQRIVTAGIDLHCHFGKRFITGAYSLMALAPNYSSGDCPSGFQGKANIIVKYPHVSLMLIKTHYI